MVVGEDDRRGHQAPPPVSRCSLTQAESKKLFNMEAECTSATSGQDEAVSALSRLPLEIPRGSEGPEPNRSVHSLAPPAVGKPELAKTLAGIPVRR